MRKTPAAAIVVAAALLLSGCGLADARKAAIAGAEVKPLDMATSLRPGLVGLADYPATGWEPSQSSTNSGSGIVDPMLLDIIGLQQSDVGSSMQVATIPDGDTLNAPTLDFCDGRYASEQLRVARMQKAVYDSDGNFAGISSEVVVYTNAAAAKQALDETIKARKACPTGRTFTSRDGQKLSFTFHTAPGPTETPLVDADSRLIVHTTMVVDGEKRRNFLVYQVYGRVLVALYVSETGAKPFDQTALDSFYGLAGDFADRLRAAPSSLLNGEALTNA